MVVAWRRRATRCAYHRARHLLDDYRTVVGQTADCARPARVEKGERAVERPPRIVWCERAVERPHRVVVRAGAAERPPGVRVVEAGEARVVLALGEEA